MFTINEVTDKFNYIKVWDFAAVKMNKLRLYTTTCVS